LVCGDFDAGTTEEPDILKAELQPFLPTEPDYDELPTQVCQPAVTIASTDGSEATAITMAKCLLLLPLPKHDALLSASASNPVHSLVGDSSSTKLKPPNKPPSRVCLLASALHCL